MTPDLQALFDDVEAAYRAADDDRHMLERAMDITSEELLERNDELATANQRLQDAARARQAFINAAAHELGTPLTPMKLQLHSLRTMTESDRERHSVEVLERNLDRVIALVGDLLDSAKLQSGRLALHPVVFDASVALAAAVDFHQPVAREADVELRVDVDGQAPVLMDETRFHQVCNNLIVNALKYSPAGHVVVRLTRQEGQVVITVADDGVGMNPERLGELFQPFGQLDESGPSGTGLGLYISKGLVEAAGGTMEGGSAGLGQGSRFSVTLPLAAEEPY